MRGAFPLFASMANAPLKRSWLLVMAAPSVVPDCPSVRAVRSVGGPGSGRRVRQCIELWPRERGDKRCEVRHLEQSKGAFATRFLDSPTKPRPCPISWSATLTRSYWPLGVAPSVPKYQLVPELMKISKSFSPGSSSSSAMEFASAVASVWADGAEGKSSGRWGR